jgi:hypothetical protein
LAGEGTSEESKIMHAALSRASSIIGAQHKETWCPEPLSYINWDFRQISARLRRYRPMAASLHTTYGHLALSRTDRQRCPPSKKGRLDTHHLVQKSATWNSSKRTCRKAALLLR